MNNYFCFIHFAASVMLIVSLFVTAALGIEADRQMRLRGCDLRDSRGLYTTDCTARTIGIDAVVL